MGGVNGGGGRTRRGGGTNKAGEHILTPKETARSASPVAKRKATMTPSTRHGTLEHRTPRIVPDHIREARAKQPEEHAKRYHTQARSAARQDQRMRKKGNTAAAEAARQKKAALDTASKYHAAQAKRQRQLAHAI